MQMMSSDQSVGRILTTDAYLTEIYKANALVSVDSTSMKFAVQDFDETKGQLKVIFCNIDLQNSYIIKYY